jgi:hypothetical protein
MNKKEEIVVYWSCGNDEFLRMEEPFNVLKEYRKDKNIDDNAHLQCPAFKDIVNNTFGVRSLYEYDITINRDKCTAQSSMSQTLFDAFFMPRSKDWSLISMNTFIFFFTEEEGLEMSQMGGFLEDTDFTKNTMVIPGKMDISKWYRPLELAVKLRKGVDVLKVSQGEPLFYISFNTDKKIKFVKYKTTPQLDAYNKDCTATKENKPKLNKLSYYYGLFTKHNMSKRILTEIKKSIF